MPKGKVIDDRETPAGIEHRELENYSGKVNWFNHNWTEEQANLLTEQYDHDPEAFWEHMSVACDRGFRFSTKYDTYSGGAYVTTISCLHTKNALHSTVISERASTASRSIAKALFVLVEVLEYGEQTTSAAASDIWF